MFAFGAGFVVGFGAAVFAVTWLTMRALRRDFERRKDRTKNENTY
jgi:hypothetical protein